MRQFVFADIAYNQQGCSRMRHVLSKNYRSIDVRPFQQMRARQGLPKVIKGRHVEGLVVIWCPASVEWARCQARSVNVRRLSQGHLADSYKS